MKRVADVLEIIEKVNMVGYYADTHQWDLITKECFGKEVLTDYTSLVGGEPATQPAQTIVDGWKAFLPGFDHTHHFITNHKVDFEGETEAKCFSSLNAWHYVKDEKMSEDEKYWAVFGTYEHHLVKGEEGWRIDKMKLNFTFQRGNGKLPGVAGERAKKK